MKKATGCRFLSINSDELVKRRKTPSPLMGEGRGEGEYNAISITYIPLPLIPSHQGRGNPTFCESVNSDSRYLF
jgi:hypothetical protein